MTSSSAIVRQGLRMGPLSVVAVNNDSDKQGLPARSVPSPGQTKLRDESHAVTNKKHGETVIENVTWRQFSNLEGNLKKSIRGLDRRLDDLTGSLAGPGLEAQIAENYGLVFQEFIGLQSRYVPKDERRKDAEWAAEYGVITKSEAAEALRIDIVVDCGKQSGKPGLSEFLIGEISIRIGMKDATRAVRRAELWEKVYGKLNVKCRPAVLGKKVSREVRKGIEEKGVLVILLED
ncbi:hypothetical protein KFL_008560050 [Klebsormidium nitens]|uniref:Uncharacterized protein n=1 Tax=Klebsormidium nitens TaxID=105231 RepID=A0A1Y1ILN4_KLENI|nr:hypothetical protein KFL_008560050 [Klebsormidium nitens]|eukprot:GAQ91795.1 hypothetical protein KFL_008560050 [Klebsormidium nitens]